MHDHDESTMTLDSYLGQLVGESQNWIDRRSGESVAGILSSVDGVRGIVDSLRAQLAAAQRTVLDNATWATVAQNRIAELEAQRVAIVGACRCGITHLALDSIDSGMSETCPTCGGVIVFDVQSPEARARQFASVPKDAELDALDDRLKKMNVLVTWDASLAITALRRRVAELEAAPRDTINLIEDDRRSAYDIAREANERREAEDIARYGRKP